MSARLWSTYRWPTQVEATESIDQSDVKGSTGDQRSVTFVRGLACLRTNEADLRQARILWQARMAAGKTVQRTEPTLDVLQEP